MRRGYDPKLILDRKGNIVGFSAGSDACAEHEVGTEKMQRDLCSQAGQTICPITGKLVNKREFERVAKGSAGLRDVGSREFFDAYFLSKKEIQFPSILEGKRITENLKKIRTEHFKDAEGQPCLALLYNASDWDVDQIKQFHKPLRQTPGFDGLLNGAWGEGAFAFAVKGEKHIKKFEPFCESVMKGNAMFAGTFSESLDGQNHAGVTLYLYDALRPEHHTAIREAQKKYEESLLTKSASFVIADLFKTYPDLQRRLEHSFLWARLSQSRHAMIRAEGGEQSKGRTWYENLREKGIAPEIRLWINPCTSMQNKMVSRRDFSIQEFIDFAERKVQRLGETRAFEPPKSAGMKF